MIRPPLFIFAQISSLYVVFVWANIRRSCRSMGRAVWITRRTDNLWIVKALSGNHIPDDAVEEGSRWTKYILKVTGNWWMKAAHDRFPAAGIESTTTCITANFSRGAPQRSYINTYTFLNPFIYLHIKKQSSIQTRTSIKSPKISSL